MAYQQGTRLPGENASKLGHLDILNSELVHNLVQQFEYPEISDQDQSGTIWNEFDPQSAQPLRLIFSVDGSLQVLQSGQAPPRELCFVKTALLRMDPVAIGKLDPDYPHPFALKKLMAESALYHATVFPLKNINIPNTNLYHAVRQIIFDSLRDPSFQGEPYETLKWLAYKKWLDIKTNSPAFACPHCGAEVETGLPFDADRGPCTHCKEEILLTDMIGFHLEMTDDAAPQSLPSAYMLIHEILLLFTGIRHFWQNNRKLLSEALFIKDGPLYLRGQYSKLVPSIRAFLAFARDKGYPVHIIGQEKSGAFFDHLSVISRYTLPKSASDLPRYAILSHQYVRAEVQRTPDLNNPYGKRTNYGEKVFVKLTPYHHMVLNIPTGEYNENKLFPNNTADFIGFDRIFATLPKLISHRHEGALVPIELAHGIASLSSYPSARILKVFAGID